MADQLPISAVMSQHLAAYFFFFFFEFSSLHFLSLAKWQMCVSRSIQPSNDKRKSLN